MQMHCDDLPPLPLKAPGGQVYHPPCFPASLRQIVFWFCGYRGDLLLCWCCFSLAYYLIFFFSATPWSGMY